MKIKLIAQALTTVVIAGAFMTPALANAATANDPKDVNTGSYYDPAHAIPDVPMNAQARQYEADKQALMNMDPKAVERLDDGTWLLSNNFGNKIEKQQKPYYCGPASLANMVRALTGNPNALSQDRAAQLLGTTADKGTNAANFASVLNRNWGSYGHWAFYTPGTPENLAKYLRAAILARHSQAIIMNVRQHELSYWNKAVNRGNGGHYNLGVGISKDNKWVKVGEVVDGWMYTPIINNVAWAINNSPSKGIVA